MKLTKIAFGIEKNWSHKHRDARLIPWHHCLIALISGIVCGDQAGMPIHTGWHILFISIILVFISVLFILSFTSRKREKWASSDINVKSIHKARWLGLWLFAWFFFGFYQGCPQPLHLPSENVSCEFYGTVETVPPGTSQINVILNEWICPDQSEKGKIRARMFLTPDELHPQTTQIHRGTAFRTTGQFSRYHAADVPGTFNAQQWARSHHIAGRIQRTYHQNQPVPLIIEQTPFSFRQKLELARRQAYEDLSAVSPEGILPALVLGSSKDIDRTTRDTFAKLGIAHVLAVSGLHFGIIAALFHILFRFIIGHIPAIMRRFGKNRSAMALSIPALAVYLFFVGVPISAQRALLMTACYTLSCLLAARSERKRSLTLAGLIILMFDPYAVFEISFQLSMSAVLGILWGLDIHEKYIQLRIEEQFWPQRIKKISASFISMLIMSISTAMTTAPFVIYHFGQLPILGILSNLIVIPYISFILMPAAMIAAFFAVTGIPGVSVVCTIAGALEKYLVAFADCIIQSIPLTYIEFAPHTIYILLAALTAVSWLYRLEFKRWRMVAAIIPSLAMIALLVLSQVSPRWLTQPDDLRISFVAMGQADATLIEFPDGRVMLVDVGSELGKESNAAQTRLIPYLRHLGIRHIDILAISHSDYDHVAGLHPLLEYAQIDEIWHNGIEPMRPNDWRLTIPESVRLIDAAQISPTQGNPVAIDVLWPNADSVAWLQDEDQFNPNESSLVLSIQMHDFSILLMGDAGTVVERALLGQSTFDHTTVLKAGHHGSKSASSSEWVSTLTPEYVVFSMGDDNRYHFPHLEVQQRFMQAQSRMYRTGEQGTIRLTTDGHRILWETCR